MKVIKGLLAGEPAYFVDVDKDHFVWTEDITEASDFEQKDAYEILEELRKIDSEVTNIEVIEADNVGFVFRDEIYPALEFLSSNFRGKVLHPGATREVAFIFQRHIKDWGIPIDYMVKIGFQIEGTNLILILPDDNMIKRVRTLH